MNSETNVNQTSTRKTFKKNQFIDLRPLGWNDFSDCRINNRKQLKSGWRKTCSVNPIKRWWYMSVGLYTLSVGCQKILIRNAWWMRWQSRWKISWNSLFRFTSTPVESKSNGEKSHSFYTNPRPINMFFWHIDYIKMQHFSFFFRSKAISFLSGEVWIHHKQ